MRMLNLDKILRSSLDFEELLSCFFKIMSSTILYSFDCEMLCFSLQNMSNILIVYC